MFRHHSFACPTAYSKIIITDKITDKITILQRVVMIMLHQIFITTSFSTTHFHFNYYKFHYNIFCGLRDRL